MIFLIRLSRLVTPYNIVQKSLQRWKIFYTILYRVTKRLSRIKKIINYHHYFFKRYPTPSAINVKKHFYISDLDSYLTVMGHSAIRKKHTEINKWEAGCTKVWNIVTGVETFTNFSTGFNCINLTNGIDKVIILYCTTFFILEAPF